MFGSTQYFRAAIENVEDYLEEKSIKLPVKDYMQTHTSYQPELDISSELNSEDGAYYQSLIEILR